MPLDTSGPALQTVGNYDLLEKVADGGMGSVYKGRHRETGNIVAIKVVAPHMVGNRVLLKRFEQEYNAARQLDHPNIVRALEYSDTGSTPYLVMEFVEGETLGQRLARDGRLPEKEAIRLIAQVAQGLYRAHKERLVHRDVKPDNILVTPDGQAKLADLGLVKEIETDLNLTRTGRGLGTPHFMAPEQFKNAKNVDARGDIYSLGATLYMMVTGEMPFKSSGPLDAYLKKIENKLTPPRQLVPTLSERVDWAIRRAMSADPDQRPATCREFVEDLTGRSTRKLVLPDGSQVRNLDTWYLVFKDEDGLCHTVRGTTLGIRRSLREGLLGDASNVRCGRLKEGPFEPLRSFPEFRDMLVTPAPLNLTPANGAPKTMPRKELAPRPEDTPTVAVEPARTPTTFSPRIAIEEAESTSAEWPAWLQALGLLLVVVLTAVVGLYIFSK